MNFFLSESICFFTTITLSSKNFLAFNFLKSSVFCHSNLIHNLTSYIKFICDSSSFSHRTKCRIQSTLLGNLYKMNPKTSELFEYQVNFSVSLTDALFINPIWTSKLCLLHVMLGKYIPKNLSLEDEKAVPKFFRNVLQIASCCSPFLVKLHTYRRQIH